MAKKTRKSNTQQNNNGAEADINFEKELWDAAVNLRGTISPGDYKHYVLPLIFLRYLSIKYERRRDQLEMMIKDKHSEYYTEDLFMKQEILDDPDEYKPVGALIIPEQSRWDYLVRHAQDDDIKIKLDHAMELLEQLYPELKGILPKIYAGSNLSRENVTGLINLLSRDIFKADEGRESDVLGRVYEYFITNFASTEGTRGGEFYTPRSIVRLLVLMMTPKEGKVFDPACGSGGMFVQSADFTYNKGNLSFYGQESVDTTLRLCKMNLILHSIDGDIKLGNSLLDDKHPNLKADFVIANPPFNTKEWGASRVSPEDKRLHVGRRRCQPTDGNGNYFWMMHFLYHLKDGGTAGFVMANGSMTTNVKEEKDCRTALIEEGFIDCVVQLPDKLFFGTGIPACLWFFSKNRNGQNGYRKRNNEILFIDARKKGVMVNRKQRVFTDEEIAEIAAVYGDYRTVDGKYTDIAGFCKVATLDEVRSQDYKLTPGVYVGTEVEEDDGVPYEVKIKELTSQLKELFAESNTLQEKIVKELDGLI